MFELHHRLAEDCIPLGRFALCRLLLMNESRYPWFILVPERSGISEIYQLAEDDQVLLIRESSLLSRTLADLFRPDKLNIAAIGNRVPQLHLHHVLRHHGDPAWPEPVWGRFRPVPYPPGAVDEIRGKLRRANVATLTLFEQ